MKNPRRIFNGAMAVILMFATSSCIWFLPQGDGSSSPSPGHEDEKLNEWCTEFPPYIIPRICAYYQLHPERFKTTGHGEEIEIRGFDAFVKNDTYFKNGHHRCSVWAGAIRDPWGKPVHFVEDLNMDGYIEAEGVRREVLKRYVNGQVQFSNQEHRFGILKLTQFKKYSPGSLHPEERVFAVTYYDERTREQ